MPDYLWSQEKDEKLKRERNISFKDAVKAIENGDLLDLIDHPNKVRYPNQKIYIVKINDYAYMMPAVIQGEIVFLKTLVANRKMNKKYLKK